MASLSNIRMALAQTISAHGDIGQSTWIYEDVEELTDLPAIIIDVDPEYSGEFEESFQGSQDTWKFNIYVLISRSKGSSEGQKMLDEYLKRLGPKSIRSAIYDNSELGLEETNARVHAVSGYGGQFEIGRVEHVGAILKVHVITDGRED